MSDIKNWLSHEMSLNQLPLVACAAQLRFLNRERSNIYDSSMTLEEKETIAKLANNLEIIADQINNFIEGEEKK